MLVERREANEREGGEEVEESSPELERERRKAWVISHGGSVG